MSSIYSLEPPTKGKVTMKTSLGDLDIELWPKEAPKACRNFVQLCLESYYDKTTFHRVIKDFMVQGGDPTGTGEGGESIYGGPFEDEFHSRLQFRRRALVACANQADKPNTNSSQFFITLGRADWLTKKNTIFGTVTGDTVYNLIRFNELETDGSDVPEDPPQIVSTSVVWNPFDDIVPRRAPGDQAGAGGGAPKARDNRARVRNKNLLSFGDEEDFGDDDGGFVFKPKKIKSPQVLAGQDSKEKGQHAREEGPGGVKGTPPTIEAPASLPKQADKSSNPEDLQKRMMMQAAQFEADFHTGGQEDRAHASGNANEGKVVEDAKDKKRKKLSLKSTLKAQSADGSQGVGDSDARRRLLKRKRRMNSGREEETLARLQKFTSGLRSGSAKGKADTKDKAGADSARESMPAAWRIDDYLGVNDDDDDGDLKSHVLNFKKPEEAGNDMVRRDNVDDYVVLDPLLEKGKAKWKKKENRKKRY